MRGLGIESDRLHRHIAPPVLWFLRTNDTSTNPQQPGRLTPPRIPALAWLSSSPATMNRTFSGCCSTWPNAPPRLAKRRSSSSSTPPLLIPRPSTNRIDCRLAKQVGSLPRRPLAAHPPAAPARPAEPSCRGRAGAQTRHGRGTSQLADVGRAEEGLIVCYDADCRCTTNYFTGIESHFADFRIAPSQPAL